MRSRFTAFALGDAAHLLRSWHPSTRPASLDLDGDIRWYRLDILSRTGGGLLDETGTVEFVAYYRAPDGNGEQHENSRFTRSAGEWVYVSAD
jgi:SEC-C motif-containing protein